MSFRKRNVALGGPSPKPAPNPSEASPNLPSGVRPSPLDGRPTTSTGTQTLDDLLGGHAGLPLGQSILIEENGTTDFAGAVLRFYAAEGVIQGHQVHVVGVGEQWGRDLPGLVGASTIESTEKEVGVDKEKMKIAWRYERLGEFGTGREASRLSPTPNRAPPITTPPTNLSSSTSTTPQPQQFTHIFDLTKRLIPPPISPHINYIPFQTTLPNPYIPVLTSLTHSLTKTPPNNLHRLILPTFLSPALYPPTSSTPTHLLPFLHSLRSLLRQYQTRLTAMLTLPLSLHPRSQGLTRWIEHLADGVLELVPFPYSVETELANSGKGGGGGSVGKDGKEEKAQGLVKVHKLPVVTEKGGGAGVGGDDLAFLLGRRRFMVRPFHLPPVEGEGGGEGEGESVMPKKKGEMEF